MDLLTQFIAPIVGLWVIHNAIFTSAEMVNKMRETVISGIYCGDPITPDHRDAIFTDWKLCIAATILVCLLFTIIVAAVSTALSEKPLIRWTGYAIAFYTFACAAGFARCSWTDAKLMALSIEEARKKPQPTVANPA